VTLERDEERAGDPVPPDPPEEDDLVPGEGVNEGAADMVDESPEADDSEGA
jgi:hypothetical protein